MVYYWLWTNIWDKVFNNGPSKICGRQSLKNLKGHDLLKQTISFQIFQRLSSTNLTWSILEYFVSFAHWDDFSENYEIEFKLKLEHGTKKICNFILMLIIPLSKLLYFTLHKCKRLVNKVNTKYTFQLKVKDSRLILLLMLSKFKQIN